MSGLDLASAPVSCAIPKNFRQPKVPAVHTDLSPDQISRFQTDGFLVLDQFLDEGELEEWRTVIMDAVQDRLALDPEVQRAFNAKYGSDELKLQNQDDPETFYANVFTQCLRLADSHADTARLIRDPRLGELAATLAGVDGVRIWHDQALFKPPYGNQTTWHMDVPYWAFHTRQSVSMWIPLDDATLDNGCLWYLPGTHQLATYDLVPITENMRDVFRAYPEWMSLEARSAPVPAGGLVVHNSMIAHSAGPNMTREPRRAMTVAFFPDGLTYNGNFDTLPVEYYTDLKVGDCLKDDRYVPLTWQRDS